MSLWLAVLKIPTGCSSDSLSLCPLPALGGVCVTIPSHPAAEATLLLAWRGPDHRRGRARGEEPMARTPAWDTGSLVCFHSCMAETGLGEGGQPRLSQEGTPAQKSLMPAH